MSRRHTTGALIFTPHQRYACRMVATVRMLSKRRDSPSACNYVTRCTGPIFTPPSPSPPPQSSLYLASPEKCRKIWRFWSSTVLLQNGERSMWSEGWVGTCKEYWGSFERITRWRFHVTVWRLLTADVKTPGAEQLNEIKYFMNTYQPNLC